MLEQSISRVLFPVSVTLYGTMAIHLAPILLSGSSNLPRDSDGQSSDVPLFGLASGGVYHASNVTIGAVSSYLAFSPLPHVMIKSFNEAVYFLWHFPSRRRDWVLPSTLPSEARTFLPPLLGSGPFRTATICPALTSDQTKLSRLLLETFIALPIEKPIAMRTTF